MLKPLASISLSAGLALALLVAACGGSDEGAQLSLKWTTEAELTSPVSPAQSLKSYVVVRNVGGADLENVSLRFNQHEVGQLPLGVSVGTVTNVSSRIEGEDQVWDLGPIEAGKGIIFPMTLWFEAASRTAEPTVVQLVMIGSGAGLPQDVLSNVFEVRVDAREATGR